MLSNEVIDQLLGISESYKAPKAMFDKMLDDKKRVELFDAFLKHESNLDYEWFQNYFESEHADRKVKKQDFTPYSISRLGALILGESDSYFEAAAGTGGMLIQSWLLNRKNKKRHYHVEELSDRAVPFLIFNMAIRGINGEVCHGDSLTNDFKTIYQIVNEGRFSKVMC
ncbi:N-6 DNA methylase [Sporolactobacillus shoreicorticis]|uniref:N-6 DNA methylase n=1 Tax=Sporolactobacillus shoreicorticis TaxID=1923877 RepID=A0ABW5S0B0_9BACL|nr:N-6 DNA methylase [Sporolactobacillus shoreicorticis]MCO7128323.1 N-6 DNA methylase [Sporolactobacillus shoreicorticis]